MKKYVVKNSVISLWGLSKAFESLLNNWEKEHPDAMVLDRQFQAIPDVLMSGEVRYVIIIRYKEWEE